MVSSNQGARKSPAPRTCRFRCALACAAALVSTAALAQNASLDQNAPEPGWRSGVSRWNGAGYTISTSTTKSPVPLAPTPVISETPYTIPVDPTKLPSPAPEPAPTPARGNISVSGPTPIANPYFAPPETDDANAVELKSPSDVQAPSPSVGITLPRDINPPGTLNAPQSVQSGSTPSTDLPAVNLPLAPLPIVAPMERMSEQEPVLPPPASIPTPRSDQEGIDWNRESLPDSESIAEQIEDEAITESAPLQEEVIRWYEYPLRWMRGWNSHAELGLDGSTGNARTLAIQTGLETKRQTDLYTIALDFDYRQASNRSTTTEDNGRFNLDYDRLLAGTPWSGFGKYGMEWDKFKAFDLRVWVNGGVGYYWVRQDDANFVTRFGAGASQEIGAPDDDWIPEAVFGAEADRQLTSRQKLKGKIDYFPAWNDFSNYRMVSDVAWEILLDDSDNLSLKLAATDRYDSTPQGAKKNDLYYSLLLLYKF